MLPTTVSSTSGSRAASTDACSRLTLSASTWASACVRTMPTWMRNLPSGLEATVVGAAGCAPPLRTSVFCDQALAIARGGWPPAEMEEVVGGGGGGGALSAGCEEPPNRPAKGLLKLQPLLCLGASWTAPDGDPPSEIPVADAVRVPAPGMAGAIGSPPPSLRPASA